MGAAAAWAVCEVAVLSGPRSNDWAPLVYTALESGGLGAGTLNRLPLRLHLGARLVGKHMGETMTRVWVGWGGMREGLGVPQGPAVPHPVVRVFVILFLVLWVLHCLVPVGS